MNQTDRAPLAGCVVADFSRILAGPSATMFLGDLGATVVKVEHPRGDDSRRYGPPFTDRSSTYYLSLNRNKRSVVLDLATDEGLADARILAHRATVLVENFRPGRLTALGLGYDEVSRENPGLVYCSISGFGGEGSPGENLAGYDFIAQAMSGFMHLTGPEGGPPFRSGIPLVDVFAGLHAVIGILTALRVRDSTGRGQHVSVNLMSSALASLVHQASAYLNAGARPRALANRHPSIAPYETFTTSDGVIALAAANNLQFGALCDALDAPSLPADPRFATNPSRVENRDALAAVLGDRIACRTTTEWVAAFRSHGIPCGPVNDLSAAFADADALGLDPTISYPDGVVTVRNPITLPGSPPDYRRSPPDLGADTDDVVRWLHTSSVPGLDP